MALSSSYVSDTMNVEWRYVDDHPCINIVRLINCSVKNKLWE